MKQFTKFFLNIRFRNKLLLSYLLVVLIPIITWAVYSFHQTNNFILGQAKTTFLNTYTTTQNNFEIKLKKIESALELITKDTTVVQIINSEYNSNYNKYYDVMHKFDPTINALQMMNTEIKEISIYTSGDIKNVRVNFFDLGDSIDELPFLSDVNFIDPIWFFQNEKLLVTQKVLSLDHQGKYAIVLFEIDPNYIFKNNVSSELENYGILIIDSNDDIIYQEDHLKNEITNGKLNLAEIKSAFQNNKNIIFIEQYTHPQNWKIIMYTDANSLLISFNSAFQSTITIILISIILILVVIILFSKTFVKRISELNHMLSGVVDGGFEMVIHSDCKDEIGEITNSVGFMVKQTRQLIDEVYKSHIQQREAEIKALQSQINPHFLYNTLSAINWQAVKSGNNSISRIAVSLSIFYRSILNKGNMVTTVKGELDNIQAYIDIQLSISNNPFNVTYEVDDKILEYNMPSIILQPIIENAIEHGLNIKENNEQGSIKIKVYEQGNDIIFEVIDNGDGMTDETIKDIIIDSNKGYGIKNVDDRLKLFFDQEYGLTFYRIKPHGTKVVVRIPKYVHF